MIEKYKKYDKLIKCILLLLIFILLTFLIKSYFKPFFFIIATYVFTNPIYRNINKLKILNKKGSAFISLILVNLILFVLFFFVGSFFINNVIFFINTIKTFLMKFSYNSEDIITNISNKYTNLTNGYLFKKGAAYTTDGIFAYIIGNIAAYFILIDKYVILSSINNFIPENNINLLKEKVKDIKNIINIQLILVLLTTLETIIGFWILNIDNALVLGILCGILDLLPYVGTIMIFVPLIFYEISLKNYFTGLALIFFYVFLLIVRQVMETKFMSSRFQIHPLLVVLSLYIGIKIFGFIGFFIGPMYVLMVKELIL